ncbi:MAG: extracellular solute-binding protein [Verrucomicrobiota bacterium]
MKGILCLLLAAAALLNARASEPLELILISPHNPSIKVETERAFSAWHRETYGQPVTLRWRETGGGTSQMLRTIHSEFAQTPETIGVDLFYGGGVDPHRDLQAAGLSAPFQLPEALAAQIPPDLSGLPMSDPDGYWHGAALSGFGILTNEVVRRIVDLPVATEWEDLARPEMFSWVSSCDPRQSGSVLLIYEIILQTYGWERGWGIIAGFSGNVRSFLKSAGSTAKAASVGDVAFAVAIDIYGWMQVAYAGADRMSFALPTDGTVIGPDGISLLRGAPHREVAERFLIWVLSEPGQKLWMLAKGQPGGAVKFDVNRMSILPGLYDELGAATPVRVNPFRLKLGLEFDPDLSNQRRRILAGLLGTVFVDLHSSCRDCWQSLLALPEGPLRENLIAEFKRPPLDEAQLLELSAEAWQDPISQNELIIGWQRAALARYEKLARQAKEAASQP